MLQTAVEAARRAGQAIVERYPAGRNVTVKGYRDIVTDADTAAEAVVLDLIAPDNDARSVDFFDDSISSGHYGHP